MKHCPKCRDVLEAKSIETVEVDECGKCKGLWFDKGELKRAKDATDPDLNWMDFDIWKHEDLFRASASDRSCPVCAKPMVSVDYGKTSITVDYCRDCQGTWLENNAFKKIIDALEAELASKPFSDYVKNAVREGVEIISGPESFVSEWKDFSTVLRLMEYRLFVENKTLQNIISSVQKSVQ